MYAAVMMYKTEPGHYDQMHAAATRAPETLKSLKGFISAVYYSDKEKDDYGVTMVWETKEDFEAYWNSIPSEDWERAKALMREPVVQNIYYVNNSF